MTCSACRKTTWAGCGRHVDRVLRDVPDDRRCNCTPATRAEPATGLLARLFGR